MSNACIIFEFRGQRYEYDGDLPGDVFAALPDELFDAEGFWVGGYPDEIDAQDADDQDTLPTARWEIEHIGGTVLEVRGARDNGAIHWEDWKRHVIY